MQTRNQEFQKGGYMNVCMYACNKHAPPEKLDALGLLLRPFWDKSRAVAAVWFAEYCI